MPLSKYGRRFDFKGACEYLDCKPSQLRTAMYANRISYGRTYGEMKLRTVNGQSQRYMKSGKCFFYESALLEFIEQQLTATHPEQAKPVVADVDRKVAKLLPSQRRFGFSEQV